MARKRKRRTHVATDPAAAKVPKSFVIKSGEVGPALGQLVKDMRLVMEPNTASQLKERKGNKLKDFVAMAGPLSVTHMLIFSRTAVCPSLRIGRIPRGPMVSFRLDSYTLTKDVLALQKRPKSPGSDFKTAPLVVLNNFNDDEKHIKLVSTVLQNLFPSIKLNVIKLADCRRVILFNLNTETGKIEFRHYSVSVKLVGVSKSIKNLIQTEIPDLNQFDDISSYILKGTMASESEVEDAGESTVTLGDRYVGRGNQKSEERAIRLSELGPRMELSITKIQAGLNEGEILYHAFVQKSAKEVKTMTAKRHKADEEKAKRKKEQEKNLEAKRLKLERENQKSVAGNPLKGKKEAPAQGSEDVEEYDDEEFDAEEQDAAEFDDDEEFGEQSDEENGMDEDEDDE